MRNKTILRRTVLLVAVLSGWALGQQGPGSAPPLSSIVSHMQSAQAQARQSNAYQVIRVYRVFGAKSSTADTQVVAQVDFVPPRERSYTIQEASGSNRGEQVVRRVLEQETDANEKHAQAAAISSDNYDFSYLGEATVDGNHCYRLRLQPKRKDKDLIAGEALVDQRTFQLRQLEGDLAKTPSWWLKKVHVRMAFADVQGTWLQTNLEAVAEVRIFGPHTLTSRLVDFRGADELAMRAIPANVKAVAGRGARGRRSKKADPAYSAVFTR